MTKPHLLVLSCALALCAAGCGDDVTNVVTQGLDCGLERNDLFDSPWFVQFGTNGSSSVGNCQCEVGGCNPADYNGDIVTVDFNVATYSPVTVFGSKESTSYQVLSDRSDGANDAAVTTELAGTVEADSCLGLFRIWLRDDGAYIECIGTFDRGTRLIDATCDTVEWDPDVDGTIDATCDLNFRIDMQAGP